jgi:radical SAM superfamily enzyme YgiQ (UPF0313 family)
MSLQNVLLIKPPGRHGLSFAMDLIPTGLEYLAAVIEGSVHEVTILDLEMERGSCNEVTKKYLSALDPDVVGISMSATDHSVGLEIAKMAKSKGAVTVLGGYHPTAIPGELLSHPEVDVVVRGEGEATMHELVVKGRPKGILGVSYKEDSSIIHNSDRKPIEDLDSLPQPARHFRRYKYRTRVMRDREHDVLTTSRGCSGRCTFCCEPYMCRSHQRYRSPQNVVDEILEIVSFHHDRPVSIEVTDPNFLGRPERVETICGLLALYDLDIRFGVKVRADSVARYPDLIRKMISVGFEGFEMGIESPSMYDIESVSKGMKTDAHLQAVRNIKQWGGNAGGTFVIGLPGQTEEQILTSPEYAKKIGLTSAAFGIATPFPGTDFYRQLESKGLITETNWDRYDEMHSAFKNEHYSSKRIEELASICMARYWTLDTLIEKERMRLIRHHDKRTLASFIDDKLQELGFSLEMGLQLQDKGLNKHVQSIIAASADPNVERYTKDIGLHNILEMETFLRILGSQTLQITIRNQGINITSWIAKTTPDGVEYIKVVPGRADTSTIDLAVNLDDFKIGKGEDLNLLDSIRIAEKMMVSNRGIKRSWNLIRFLLATSFESFGYFGLTMSDRTEKAFNDLHYPVTKASKKNPSRQRYRRLSY